MSLEAIVGAMAVLSGLDFGFGQANSATSYSYSKKLAAQNYRYQSALLQKQQEWAERMSNTAHQREVTDLRAAGLNPILSASGGNGASSPVVSASAPAAPVFHGSTSNIASSSAKAVSDIQRAFDTEVKKVNAEISNSNKVATATVKKLDSEAKYLDAQTSRTRIGPVDIPGNFINSVPSFVGKGVDAYLDHVGRPFSQWMNNTAKSVGDFFGSMKRSPSRGRDYPKGRIVTDDIEKGKNIFRVKYDNNVKGWKR